MNFFYRNNSDVSAPSVASQFPEGIIAPSTSSFPPPPTIRKTPELMESPSDPATQKKSKPGLVAQWELVENKLVCTWVPNKQSC